MSEAFSEVQHIVLVGASWRFARHFMLDFGEASVRKSVLRFLNRLLDSSPPTSAGAAHSKPQVQISLGFTRFGLKRVNVPDHVLACFALKAPAFWAGAAQRAPTHLGLAGENAPEHWDECFVPASLHAVLSVHARSKEGLEARVKDIQDWAAESNLNIARALEAAALKPPDKEKGQWVHFGYRDGLARIGIEGWTDQVALKKDYQTVSMYKAGEFVLGHTPDRGADPWASGPGLRVWPDKTRAFFRNGSFGILQKIEQRAALFEEFVKDVATDKKVEVDVVKGWLCGRRPAGEPLVNLEAKPEGDFNYKGDEKGVCCPFGSHIRRMNPRVQYSEHGENRQDEKALLEYPAHFSRPRPILRRGMPYGDPLRDQQVDDGTRGLVGQFFCASIENQFEHLLGQWSDRVPLGSPDTGGARDPFMGAHAPGDGPFMLGNGERLTQYSAGEKRGMKPFTRTRGVAYLFYPSISTLKDIAANSLWGLDDEDSEE